MPQFKRKFFRSGMKTLIILNEEINDIIAIIKPLKKYGFSIKGVIKAIKNEAKQQKGVFFRHAIRYIWC